MTREECENLIAEKLHEIAEIYIQYNPAGKYLSLSFLVTSADEANEAERYYQFNNEYWDNTAIRSKGRDADCPINYSESVKIEEGDSVESE